eukprot:c13015_g4_i1 orf=178-375(+)
MSTVIIFFKLISNVQGDATQKSTPTPEAEDSVKISFSSYLVGDIYKGRPYFMESLTGWSEWMLIS